MRERIRTAVTISIAAMMGAGVSAAIVRLPAVSSSLHMSGRPDAGSATIDVDPLPGEDAQTAGRLQHDAHAAIKGGTTDAHLERVPYLGLTGSPVPRELAERLKLRWGEGLLVDHVDRGSPGEVAGVRAGDVLEMFDDQRVVDLHQLGVLVRTASIGQRVTLKLIRDGHPIAVSPQLAAREAPRLEADQDPWGAPKGVRWADFDNASNRMQLQEPARGYVAHFIDGSVVDVNDGQIEFVLIIYVNGTRELTVQDPKAHRQLFKGPVNSDGDFAALPPIAIDGLRRIFGNAYPSFLRMTVHNPKADPAQIQ